MGIQMFIQMMLILWKSLCQIIAQKDPNYQKMSDCFPAPERIQA